MEGTEAILQIEHDMKEQHLYPIFEGMAKSVIAQIEAAGKILEAEYERNIIDSISWRIKKPESIYRKLVRKKRETTLACAKETLHDLIGVRVVCPFQDDVFLLMEELKNSPGMKIYNIKNFISHPKASGYRSIHIILELDHAQQEKIYLEIQIRSVAMNYWAILDHRLCYKNENKKSQEIRKELRECAIEIANIDKKFYKLRKRIEKLKDENS